MKIERSGTRVMTFEDHDWKNILKYKEAGVRWQLMPDETKAPEPVVNPGEAEAGIQISALEKLEQAVESGAVEKRRGGWYFYKGKNIGRLDDAVKNFNEL